MKDLFFLKKMYCKNDLRPLLYIYPFFFGQKSLKLAKRCPKDHKLEKNVGTGIYAQHCLLTLRQKCKSKSYSESRSKYKYAFIFSKYENRKKEIFVPFLNLWTKVSSS